MATDKKKVSVTLGQKRAVPEPQGNVKETLSFPTCSESISDPTGPGPSLEEKAATTPQNMTTSFTESNDDTSRSLSLQDEEIPTKIEGNLEKQVQQHDMYSDLTNIAISWMYVAWYN